MSSASAPSIGRKNFSVESAVRNSSTHGRMGRRAVLQKASCIAPAGCAVKSLMTIRSFGINVRRRTPLISCVRSSSPTTKNATHPRPAKHRRLRAGSVFDHIHYHRRVRSTRKQRRKERQRGSKTERKLLKTATNKLKKFSRFLWDQQAARSIRATGTKIS